MEWSSLHDDCGGVLSPDVNGLRVLYNVRTKKTIPWQKPVSDAEGDIIVGKYSFDPGAFTIAAGWLDEHLHDPEVRQIILDEVGSLELDGKGWGPWLASALPQLGEKTLILVVRRSLLDDVINLYGLEEVSVVEKDYFLA